MRVGKRNTTRRESRVSGVADDVTDFVAKNGFLLPIEKILIDDDSFLTENTLPKAVDSGRQVHVIDCAFKFRLLAV